MAVDQAVFQAPGRVNLIGEHTDYNDGFVLPVAIQLRTRVTAIREPGSEIHVRSTLYSEDAVFDAQSRKAAAGRHWSDYVRGVALSLEEAGFPTQGCRLFIESDIPVGSGLSSSAALEVASAMSLLAIAGMRCDPVQLAQICHHAENDWVGTRSGVMDQFAACLGKSDHAMLLDCRSLSMRYVSLPGEIAMMVCNTMVHHELSSSEYNLRREQCEQGVAILASFLPGVRSLRDVSAAQLEKYSAELELTIHRRCRHVVEENRRVLAGVEALERGNIAMFGTLMAQSHQSLRLDYEVSCAELDIMCELALDMEGVYGARMVGGGFGGCVLALVDKSSTAEFRRHMEDGYHKRLGIQCEIYECVAADGAGPVK